jgi:hypothetical protein
VGNYVALVATHYRTSPVNHLESGLPNAAGPNAGGVDCRNVAHCGNGGLPFPGIVDGMVPTRGLSWLFKDNRSVSCAELADLLVGHPNVSDRQLEMLRGGAIQEQGAV